jgi:CTP synthase (UTP-ammonia lyase)
VCIKSLQLRGLEVEDTNRIALIGDYDASVLAHRAIPASLEFAASSLGVTVTPIWVGTSTISATASELAEYAGVWCVPASPYASMAGALAAIRFAREYPRPFLGTCGGFQHAVIEYLRSVGHTSADHAETAPHALTQVITPLSCSLVEKNGTVFVRPGSTLAAIYGTDRVEEQYHCNYGVNSEYAGLLAGPTGLQAVAHDDAGEVRAVALSGHPFFIATLYQPERAGLRGDMHPLVRAFVAAAVKA